MDIKNEIIENIKNDTIYNYIATNYYLLSKDMLKQVLLEYIYILDTTKKDNEVAKNRLIDNINEYL